MADVKGLVDSGATDNFIRPAFAKRMGLGLQVLDRPKKIYNIDKTENQAGSITHYTDLDVQTKGIRKVMRFLVTDIGDEDLVLGYPWLSTPSLDTSHSDTNSDWANDHRRRQNNILFELEEQCQLRTTATELAIQAGQHTKEVELPTPYQQFAKLFNEEASHRFPPSRPWDHAIEFKPNTPAISQHGALALQHDTAPSRHDTDAAPWRCDTTRRCHATTPTRRPGAATRHGSVTPRHRRGAAPTRRPGAATRHSAVTPRHRRGAAPTRRLDTATPTPRRALVLRHRRGALTLRHQHATTPTWRIDAAPWCFDTDTAPSRHDTDAAPHQHGALALRHRFGAAPTRRPGAASPTRRRHAVVWRYDTVEIDR
ncbi:hypothetical protein EDB85DRAFT_2154115 [Lactarius pseudohatsudake]|nr:hypothetical protein EDB85DRAFT_2154115 [Lactarius pseudohatsudake]